MKYDKYEDVISSSDKMEFQFESIGPKGKILKVIQFTKTKNTDIFNLAFGNLLISGKVDDETTSDNKDRNKVLATVAATIYEFTSLYPEKLVFFCGTTPNRTRLYRMAITLNLNELNKDFVIYGVSLQGNTFERVIFRKGIDYFGFMIKRKKRNFTRYEKD